MIGALKNFWYQKLSKDVSNENKKHFYEKGVLGP